MQNDGKKQTNDSLVRNHRHIMTKSAPTVPAVFCTLNIGLTFHFPQKRTARTMFFFLHSLVRKTETQFSIIATAIRTAKKLVGTRTTLRDDFLGMLPIPIVNFDVKKKIAADLFGLFFKSPSCGLGCIVHRHGHHIGSAP